MKKLLILVLLLCPFLSTGQSPKLIRDEVDKFTKQSIKETNYTWCATKGLVASLQVKGRITNGRPALSFLHTSTSIFSIREGDYVYLLFDNDSTLKLQCFKGEIASRNEVCWYGCGWYELSNDDIAMILRNTVNSIRIDLGDEYIEFNNIKDRLKNRIKTTISLLYYGSLDDELQGVPE